LKFNGLNKRQIIIALGATITVIVIFGTLYLLSFNAFPSPGGTPQFQYKISKNKANNLSSPLAVSMFPFENDKYFFPLNKLINYFNKANKIIVANSGKNLIQIYDYHGSLIRSFSINSVKFKGNNKYVCLKDLCVDDVGNIYVSTNLPYLLVFNSLGKFLKRFPSIKLKNGKAVLNSPTSSYFYKNKLYVIDGVESKIKIFDLSGKLLLQFGGKGSKPGKFRYPDSVIVKSNDDIVVTDSGNSRLQVFNSFGKLQSIIDNSEAPLVSPRGIDIDPWQNIHVVDTFSQKVLVFDNSWHYLFFYGSGEMGSGLRDFSFPNGITIDQNNGRIFIADCGNSRISVWSY
jgi:DNA-binding beta-propeller fold protein YncE